MEGGAGIDLVLAILAIVAGAAAIFMRDARPAGAGVILLALAMLL